jgi:catechol 2,3-dioxygenase-like lactoylglutathione lyase family enzyme
MTRRGMSRREMLASLPALMMAPRLLAQTSTPLRVRGLHHLMLSVSDVKRSVDFYQGLFGMPIQARQGSTVCLRIGSGPKYLAIAPMVPGGAPSISQYGIAIEDFNVDRVLKALSGHGITQVGATQQAGISRDNPGPRRAIVQMREETRELFVGDPDGIPFQLEDPRSCGGKGEVGATCAAVEPSPKKGLLAVTDLSHFTIGASSSEQSNKFFQEVFGFQVQAHQGPTAPLLGVGPGVHFLMFTGGGAPRGTNPAAPARGPRIDHACLGMANFNPDNVVKILEGYGIKPRGQAPSTPLVWYISQRMENRGGAPGTGTPELYFTDPDNIPIQLQDVKYCGGGGFLGDVCPDSR